MKVVLLIILLITAIASFVVFRPVKELSTPSQESNTKTTTSADIPLSEIVATDLQVPWSIAFLPNKDILVTERIGRLQRIDPQGKKTLVATLSDVKQTGESGLHGIALHPDFEKNNYVYVYYTYSANGSDTKNRVVRFTLTNNTLTDKTIIVDAIPGALFHDGGRIKFGPDKFLYISTGDAQEPSLAQDKNSLAGKILRVTDDGKPAPDNPFNTRIYSYGHRNPQGFTWDNTGQLWETEHGQSATDEVNHIGIGNNYGWPDIRGNEKRQGMITPTLQSADATWAPGDIAFLDGSLYFVGLRGQALFSINLSQTPLIVKEHLKGEFGRMREIAVGPDNLLYITTSNRDGRGAPSSGDDRIIRINPTKL